MRVPQTLLNETDRTLLVDALRLAATQYDADQLTCNQAGQTGLGEQFSRQSIHARKLASQIEDAINVCLE